MANTGSASLDALYNTPVKKAEWVQRPKEGVPDWVPKMYPTTHSGVRVTLDDGKNSQYLVHKGPGYGKSWETVVTDAANMSDKWKVKDSYNLGGSKTVHDFVKAGGQDYSVMNGQHCHRAAKDMMTMGNK